MSDQSSSPSEQVGPVPPLCHHCAGYLKPTPATTMQTGTCVVCGAAVWIDSTGSPRIHVTGQDATEVARVTRELAAEMVAGRWSPPPIPSGNPANKTDNVISGKASNAVQAGMVNTIIMNPTGPINLSSESQHQPADHDEDAE